MATELKIPVKLEVLLDSVTLIKTILSNLKPEFSGFKALLSILRSMEKEANNLQVALSKPFSSLTLFNAAEKSLEKIDDALTGVWMTASHIKFSDLKLNSSLLVDFNNFLNLIKAAEKELDLFKDKLKLQFLSNDKTLSLLKLDPSLETRNFDEIIKVILKKSAEIGRAYAKVEKNSESFLALQEKAQATEKFFLGNRQLKSLMPIEEFNKMFSFRGENKNLVFRNGGKSLFEEWAKENLTLPEEMQLQLKDKTAKEIQEYFSNINIDDILKHTNKVSTNASKGLSDINNKKEELEAYKLAIAAVLEVLKSADGDLSKLLANLDKAREALTKWQEAVANSARSGQAFKNTNSAIVAETLRVKTALLQYNAEWQKLNNISTSFNSMKMAITNFMGFNQVLNLVKRGVKEAASHIKELDTVMNRISIVTDMSTSDLWNLIDAYSEMAQKYGVSIKGAYEVSLIYYQQGLETADVMTLTNETLKLSKVSGLDYASATDYMTTAIRGFKMEMLDASTVVDVYSALAAHTAVSLEELAVAMSKTASSMEGVGATFEESSAMIGTMVAVTRESATNIGSALKSIASRYGELTKDPTKLIDSEGEAFSFNKVDTALQSVGISMKTVDGQFRNFTDVIVELGEKWQSLDSTQLRYIATQFAGNRQQSRFLALVSNVDLLKENIATAEGSEDTGTLQALKSMDSLTSKLEQVKVAYLQFYTSIGAEEVWKSALDGIRGFINTLNGLPKLFGKIPISAIAMIGDIISVLKNIGNHLITGIAHIWIKALPIDQIDKTVGGSIVDTMREIGVQAGKALGEGMKEGTAQGAEDAAQEATNKAAQATADTLKDKNQEAGKLKKENEEAEQKIGKTTPVETKAIENIDLSAVATNNAEALNTLAVAAEKAAGAMANLVGVLLLFTETPLLVPEKEYSIFDAEPLKNSIANLGLQDQILELFNNLNIDVSTPTELLLDAFVQIFSSIKDESGQLKALFESASDDAIMGYIVGLLKNAGKVSAAGAEVGKISVTALRNSIGAHSPAVATMLAGTDYMNGLTQGISKHLNEAMAKGEEAGRSAVAGLEKGLELKESTFAGLKTAILKEFDLLDDSAFGTSEKRSNIRAQLEGTTFKGFLGGAADPVFYKFAKMRQDIAERWADFGTAKLDATGLFKGSKKAAAFLDTLQSPEDFHSQYANPSLKAGSRKILDAMSKHMYHRGTRDNLIADYEISGTPFPDTIYGRRARIYEGYGEKSWANRNNLLEVTPEDQTPAAVDTSKQREEIQALIEKLLLLNDTKVDGAKILENFDNGADATKIIEDLNNKLAEALKLAELTGEAVNEVEKQQLNVPSENTVPILTENEYMTQNRMSQAVKSLPAEFMIPKPELVQKTETVEPIVQEIIPQNDEVDTALQENLEKGTSLPVQLPVEAGNNSVPEVLTENLDKGQELPVQQEVVPNNDLADLNLNTLPAKEQEKEPFKREDSKLNLHEVAEKIEPPDVEIIQAKLLELNELINKMVEVGKMSEEAGNQMKQSFSNASPNELTDKILELKAELQETGELAPTIVDKIRNSFENVKTTLSGLSKNGALGGFGSALTMIAGLIDKTSRSGQVFAGSIVAISGAIKAMDAISKAATGNPWLAAAMAIMSIANGISMIIETDTERLERLNKAAEEASNNAKKAKSEYNEMSKGTKKVEELAEKRYESAEAAEEYSTAVDDLASKFPLLVVGFDSMGNAIVDTVNSEKILEEARLASAKASLEAAKAERDAAKEKLRQKALEASKAVKGLDDVNYFTGTVGSDLNYDPMQELLAVLVALNNNKYGLNGIRGLSEIAFGTDLISATEVNNKDSAIEFFNSIVESLSDKEAEDFTTGVEKGWYDVFKDYLEGSYNAESNGIDLEKVRESLNAEKEKLKKQGDGKTLSAEASLLLEYLNSILETRSLTQGLIETDLTDTERISEIYSRADKALQDYAINEGISSDIDLLNNLKNNLANSLENEDIESANKYYSLWTDFYKLLSKNEESPLWQLRGEIIKTYNDKIQKAMDGYAALGTAYKSSNKRIISDSILDMQNSQETALSFISNNSQLLGVVATDIDKLFSAAQKENSALKVEDFVKTDDVQKLVAVYDNFYSSLSGLFVNGNENALIAFERMLLDTRHYSKLDIVDTFKNENIDIPEEVRNGLSALYDEAALFMKGLIKDNLFNKKLNLSKQRKSTKGIEQLQNFVDNNLSPDELSLADQEYFAIVAELTEQLAELGYGNSSELFAQYSTDLFNNLDTLEKNLSDAILDSIKENGLLTAQGILNIINTAKNLGVDPNSTALANLSDIYKMMTLNILLATSSLISNATDAWKDTSKKISDLSSGISFTEIQSYLDEATNLGIDLSRLDFVDAGNGKYKLNIDKVLEYWDALKDQMDGSSDEWQGMLDKAISSLKENFNGKEIADLTVRDIDSNFTLNEGIRTSLLQVMGDGYTRFFDESGKIIDTPKNKLEFIKALQEGAQKTSEGISQVSDFFLRGVNELFNTTVDVADYLDGSRDKKSRDKLKDEIKTAFASRGLRLPDALAEYYINLLETGGATAEIALRTINPDATEEQLAEVYTNSIKKYLDSLGKLSEVHQGDVVTGQLREILNELNMVDKLGVVQETFNAVQVYLLIYNKMSETAGATTASLNDAYAQLLTAQDQTNIDITEALKNGNGMSYADFGNLLAKYDIKFEDYMRDHWDTVMRDGFGNIRITDWEGFAKNVFKTKTDNLDAIKNTDEYISAFKAYNDGLIELNKNAELAIVDEIKQIENAKTGDWLNFSELWTKLESAWETIDFKTAVPNYNGNVSNMGHRVIVPGKIMDLYFGGHNGWGTIFGEDVAFKEFGETYANIGATFANLTEEGKKAPDIAAYAKELYSMAISRVGGDASKVTADLIKLVDAEEENLILNIKDFGDSVKPEEVLNALWEESDLYHKAEEQAYSATEVINASLQMYSASLEDGILKIGENANLLGVAQVLLEASEMAGLEIGNGLEEVKDTVLNILKSYSDAIMKGIDGGLSNTEAADLQLKASDMGIKDLQFTQTKEGLKLSNESAKELYNTLKLIDALLGELVFSKLMDSLIATEDHFKTILDTLAYINKLRSEIEAPNNAERLKSLLDELDLAEKINMTRSIETEDDSFKFMEGKIPDALNNPLNYWKNWAKAFDAMKKAGKGSGAAKNTMGYEDFYNIISEMGRLADITGKGVQLGEHTLDNSLKAADLITQAAGALKNVNGELVVDLSGIKVDFTSGLADLGDLIDGLVDALADSQIHMLDAIIAVLEIIVAMEKLKDLDIDNDLTLDFSELGIEVNDDGSIKNVNENLKGTVNDLLNLEATLEDGTSVLDAVSILSDKFNITMRDFLEHYRDVDWLNEKGITGDMYKTLFSNMLKLVASPDWLDAAKNGSNFFEMMNRYDWGDLVIGVNTPDVTLRMGGTGNLSIDWSNVDSEAYERAFEQEFNEQVKADLLKALDTQSSTETGLTAETNTKLKILNHTVVEVTDEKGNKTKEYTIAGHPGKKYSNKTLAAAVAELYEQGATEIDDTLWSRETKVRGKIKIGSAEFELESDGGDAKYKFQGRIGKNATETFNKFISEVEKDDKSGLFDKDGAINLESARYKELQVLYGLSLTPIITYTTSDGKTKEGNINKNTVLRDAVKDYLDTDTTEDIKVRDKATTVTLKGGIKATIPNDLLEFEIDESGNPQVTADSLKSYFNNLVGLDLGLKDTISSAIKDALSGITEQLNSLEPGKLSEVGSALKEIAAALADIASKDIEKLIEQIKGLQSAAENLDTELNIPENIDESEFESALTRIIHEAAEAVANDNTFKEITGKIGESGGLTLVDKFGKELSNMAEQVMPLLTLAALHLSKQTAIMGEAGQTLGKAIVEGIAEGMKDILQTVQAINPLLLGMAAGIAGIGLTSVLLVPLQIILETIAEKLGEIKANSNITINIQANAGNVAGELQKVVDNLKELSKLASNIAIDSPQSPVELPNKPEAPKGSEELPSNRPKEFSFENGDGPVNPAGIQPPEGVNVPVKFGPVDSSEVEAASSEERDVPAELKPTGDAPDFPPVDIPVTPQPEGGENVEVEGIAKLEPEVEEKDLSAEGEINYTTGEVLELEELIAEGTVNWKNGSKPAAPHFEATGIIHWRSSAFAAGTFHKYRTLPKDRLPLTKSDLKKNDSQNNRKSKSAAQGTFGPALVGGTPTLMGELGPELVVSNGKYKIVGIEGPEMVPLAKDAIVFNHIQTRSLLTKGMSKERGRAVTNERNAVAFATGNVEGPAMASASAALNALKQLRAMWESLKSASISDLAGAGGGGGGGGGGNNAKIVNPSIWVDTVERWYNLMQKIAKLEKEITHEEKLRSKLSSDWTANGNHYYASQKRSLEALRDLIDAQEQLNLSREAYYDQRVEALQNLPFGKLIEFDNEGQMRFKEGAMDWLTNLVGFDQNGKANYTDEEKYNILMAAGYGDYMKYDSSGGEIKMDEDNNGEVTDEERQSFYGNATKAFWDKINDYKDATQSLWDSIKEGEDSILQLQADQNELLADIRENQMAVEDAVLDAIEDMRQREIDALLDERDKLEESTLKYIDGLSDALNREQEMYLNLEDENSLNQLKRRLAILQRSGGSAEDIANLRAEIDSSERERYFNLQQLQIDAILRASDLEIERMDSLIELMTETLEYLKEYGLLWGNVYEVMEGTAAQITSFIIHGNSEFWALSPLGTSDQANQTLFKAELWSSYRKDLNDAKEKIGENEVTAKDIRDNMALMVTMTRRQLADTDYTIFDEAMKAEFGEDYDPNSAYKQLFYDDYMGHGDVTRATATARAKYAADKKAAEDAAAAALAAAAVPAAEEPHGGEPEEDKGCPDCAVNCGGACYNACLNECALKCQGKTRLHDENIGNCNAHCINTARGHTGTNHIEGNAYYVKKDNATGKAAGGYVGHGIYELGERGTETVLTASQTRVLRLNILSNRPNSLISLLKSYNEGYDGINNSLDGVTPVEDNSVNIEHVEMTMEVKQIANDYDARKAGEQALNEMMRIARKTGATNSIRR